MSVLSIFEIIQIISERRRVKARIERQRSAAGGSPFAGSSPPFPSEDDDHHDHDDNVYMTMMMTNQHDHKRMIIHIIKCSHMLNLYIILNLKTFQTTWKLSRQLRNFPEKVETFQTN